MEPPNSKSSELSIYIGVTTEMWKINRGEQGSDRERTIRVQGERRKEIYLGRMERDKYRRKEGGKRTGRVSEKVLRNHTINYTLKYNNVNLHINMYK